MVPFFSVIFFPVPSLRPTPNILSFSDNSFQPFKSPLPSRKHKKNHFTPKSLTVHRMKDPALFERLSSLYFLSASSHFVNRSWLRAIFSQSSKPRSRCRRLLSPNLIHDVTPLHLSQMDHFNFLLFSSIAISNDLASTTNQALPPLISKGD